MDSHTTIKECCEHPRYAAAQVLVVACILLVVPRGSTRAAFISRLAPDTFSKRAEQMKDSIPPGQGRDVFCIVFDAGSTGAKL